MRDLQGLARALLALGLGAAVAGCGGGAQQPSGAVDDGSAADTTPLDGDHATRLDLGAVRIEAASGLKRFDLPSPQTGAVLFTGYYGAKITRLAEMGPGRIAMASAKAGAPYYDLVTQDPTGRDVFYWLTLPSSDERTPAWSADGSRVAFASTNSGGPPDVYVLAQGGGGVKRLTTDAAIDFSPCWSPDGSQIAFETNRSGNWDVYTMKSTDGSGQTPLAATAGFERHPSWSPTGQSVAFAANSTKAAGGYDICTVAAASGLELRNLTANGGSVDDDSPAWSTDGSRLAWSRLNASTGWDIWVMDANGQNWQQVTSSNADETHPTWSPDGAQIAYQVGLRVRVIDLGDPSRSYDLAPPAASAIEPDWSRVPQRVRSLIGPAGSDNGYSPPYGTGQGFILLGLAADGLVGTMGVDVPSASWSSISASGLSNTGNQLVGALIEANQIDAVREDRGPGTRPIVWPTAGSPVTKSVLVLLSASTGRVVTVLPGASQALAAGAGTQAVSTELDGGRLVIRGRFTSAWGADPSVNGAPKGATRVELDAASGEVLSTT